MPGCENVTGMICLVVSVAFGIYHQSTASGKMQMCRCRCRTFKMQRNIAETICRRYGLELMADLASDLRLGLGLGLALQCASTSAFYAFDIALAHLRFTRDRGPVADAKSYGDFVTFCTLIFSYPGVRTPSVCNLDRNCNVKLPSYKTPATKCHVMKRSGYDTFGTAYLKRQPVPPDPPEATLVLWLSRVLG